MPIRNHGILDELQPELRETLSRLNVISTLFPMLLKNNFKRIGQRSVVGLEMKSSESEGFLGDSSSKSIRTIANKSVLENAGWFSRTKQQTLLNHVKLLICFPS